MECKKALKSGTIVVTLLVAAILTTQQAQQQAQARPLFAGQGWDDGYAEGKDDFLVGSAKEYDCSPNNSDEYCQDYRNGYDSGWDAQESLGRSQGSFEHDDDGDN